MKLGSFGNIAELVRKGRREAALVGAAALILASLTGFSFWLTHRVLRDFETADDLNEIDEAAAKITVEGARYPEKLEQMTGR